MSAILTHPPQTPHRRFGTVAAGIAVLIAIVVVFFGISRLVQDPDVVDRIEIRNPTVDLVNVLASSGGDDAQVAVAIVEPNRTAVALDVIDQGDEWVFEFRASGRTVATLALSRDELEQAGWRITVPGGDEGAAPDESG